VFKLTLAAISIKIIIGFFALFLIIKILGKKIINQITPFTFIAAIVLSELLGNALYNDKATITHVLFSMSLWGLLLFLIEYIGLKSRLFKRISEGKPTILIRNGEIDFTELKKSRMTINQLQSLLRQSETFSIREVAFAFLESNGSMSVLKKSANQKTTQQDFNMPFKPVYLPITLIRDGVVIKENLEELGKDQNWLHVQVGQTGPYSLNHIALAEWLENDGLLVIPYK
jgi:uncharacterized membrane protein YcaP (DUF421 family)